MFRIILITFSLLATSFCAAAEWSVDRVRGEAQFRPHGSWLPLSPGMVVENGVLVRTGADGRVDLIRAAEVVTLGANTQIEIKDAGSELMTSIIQESGVVTADVERRNVQHFSIQTPFLAAVVKGTKFVVTTDANGASVHVERGVVQVQDTDNELVVDIKPGQDAVVTQNHPLEVLGNNPAPIFTFDGQLVETSQSSGSTVSSKAASSAATVPVVTGDGNSNVRGNADNVEPGSGNNGLGKGSENGNANDGAAGGGNAGNAAGNGNGNGNAGQGNNGNENAGQGNNGNGNGNGNAGQGDNGKANGGDNGNAGGNGGGNGTGNNGNGGDGAEDKGQGNNGNSNAGQGNNGNGNGNENNGNGGNNGNGNGGGSGKENNGNGNSNGNGN